MKKILNMDGWIEINNMDKHIDYSLSMLQYHASIAAGTSSVIFTILNFVLLFVVF